MGGEGGRGGGDWRGGRVRDRKKGRGREGGGGPGAQQRVLSKS